MPQLLVRNLDEQLVSKLKTQAASHGRSTEEEHRHILRAALQADAPQENFKSFLLKDADTLPDIPLFEREHSEDKPNPFEL